MKNLFLDFIRPFPVIILTLFSIFPEKSKAQAALPDSTIQQRIKVIQSMLDQGRPGARRWWGGWLIGYGTATAVQGVLFFTAADLKTRQDMADGAATTLLGVGGQLITPMTPSGAPRILRNLPAGSPENDQAKLDAAEDLLLKSCLREKTGRAWEAHVVTSAVNIGSGLVVWLGFKRPLLQGVENFAINAAVTEAQIWSQPVRAIRDYKRYCREYQTGHAVSIDKDKWNWYVSVYPGGARVDVWF